MVLVSQLFSISSQRQYSTLFQLSFFAKMTNITLCFIFFLSLCNFQNFYVLSILQIHITVFRNRFSCIYLAWDSFCFKNMKILVLQPFQNILIINLFEHCIFPILFSPFQNYNYTFIRSSLYFNLILSLKKKIFLCCTVGNFSFLFFLNALFFLQLCLICHLTCLVYFTLKPLYFYFRVRISVLFLLKSDLSQSSIQMKKRNQHSVWTMRTPQTQHCFVPKIAPEYGGGDGGMVRIERQLICEQ